MHPRRKDGVELWRRKNKKTGGCRYYARNEAGQAYRISRQVRDALLHADGRSPINLPRELIDRMKEADLITTSRFVRGNDRYNYIIVSPIGKGALWAREVFKSINSVLPWLAAFAFLTGLVIRVLNDTGIEGPFRFYWTFPIVLLGVLFHEYGHYLSARAYGHRIRSTGLVLLGIMPIGAYVESGGKRPAAKREELQQVLAGIEMNILLSGILMILSVIIEAISLLLIIAAAANMVLAVSNMIPTAGQDGEKALSVVLEVDSIYDLSKEWMTDPEKRHKVLHSGIYGYAWALLFTLILACNATTLAWEYLHDRKSTREELYEQ